MPLPTILMIDSSAEAADLVRFALWRSNLCCGFHQHDPEIDGMQSVMQPGRRASDNVLPSMILLETDLNDFDALAWLRRLRADPRTANVPVIVFPSSNYLVDKEAAMAAGASDYLPKPVDADEYMACVARLYRVWCMKGDGAAPPSFSTPAGDASKRRFSDWKLPFAQWTKPPLTNLTGSASMMAMSLSSPC